MFIMRLSVPVTDYYRSDVFFKEYFFEVDKCPPKESVIKYIESKIELLMADEEDCSESKEAVYIINLMNDWCYVSPNSVIMTNTFVEHPKFGQQPVSFEIIRPIRL